MRILNEVVALVLLSTSLALAQFRPVSEPLYITGTSGGVSLALDDSLLVNDGARFAGRATFGGISIGTTTPESTLNVIGDITIGENLGTDYELIFQNSGDFGYDPGIRSNSNADLILRAHGTGSDIQFETGNPESVRMFIDQDGSVGINDTDPSSSAQRLSVYDNTAHSDPLVKVHSDNASATGAVLGIDMDAHSVSQIDISSTVVDNGNASSGGIYHNRISSIADDGTATLYSGNVFGPRMMLFTASGGGGHTDYASAILSVWAGTTPAATILSQGGATTVSVSTSDVTGTTGTDGEFTISVRPGIIEVENRANSSANVSIYLLF